MVDWLILSCAKEGRRRRTWEEKGKGKGKGKGKVCLGRNVDRGKREGWRGGRSMRDARG